MAGTFTNINIGRKTYNMNSGKHAEMFYDMVKINLDSSNYVTSPYITVDDSLWVAESLHDGSYRIVCTSTAEAGWSWYFNGEYQADATDAQLQSAFGLAIHYPSIPQTVSKAIGDEINITKRTEYEGKYSITASYTRRGGVLEVDCPLLRNTIPTSPYINVDSAQWETGASESMLPHSNGNYSFTWNGSSWGVIYNDVVAGFLSDVAIYNIYGIIINYPDETSAKTRSDNIVVIRSTDETSGGAHYEYIYHQTENASPAQQLANEIFKAVYGLGYQPLRADNAIINPAAEIGDTLTVCGVTSGLYYQETTFNRLMSSSVGAQSSSEEDPEMNYENKQDRNYSRKFYDIASELNIQASQISAKVSRASPAGQKSFSWELFDDHFSVLCDGDHMLYIDKEGSQFAGKVMANQIVVDELTVGGQTFPAGWIQGSESDYPQIATNSIGGGGYGFGDVALGTIASANLTTTVNEDIQKGVDAYGMLAYGFGALSADEVYAGKLMVSGGFSETAYQQATWCMKDISGVGYIFYLGHY